MRVDHDDQRGDHQDQEDGAQHQPEAKAPAFTPGAARAWRGRGWWPYWRRRHLRPERLCSGFLAFGFFGRGGRRQGEVGGRHPFVRSCGRRRDVGNLVQKLSNPIFSGRHPDQIGKRASWRWLAQLARGASAWGCWCLRRRRVRSGRYAGETRRRRLLVCVLRPCGSFLPLLVECSSFPSLLPGRFRGLCRPGAWRCAARRLLRRGVCFVVFHSFHGYCSREPLSEALSSCSYFITLR